MKASDSTSAPNARCPGFLCNICGFENQGPVESFDREVANCSRCGSSVRWRSVVYMLSQELFGAALTVEEFPVLKGIRGLGISDAPEYAQLLGQKFDYKNTFYTMEPKFDVTKVDEKEFGAYDFIISSEIFEHVAAPVETAFRNAYHLLRPNGVLLLTVPYTFETDITEHFPSLHDYALVSLTDRLVLLNRTAEGRTEVFDDLIFHGGHGSTLEMRRFSEQGLRRALGEAGFSTLHFYSENHPPFGIIHRLNWSLPLAASKGILTLGRANVADLARQFRLWQQGTRQMDTDLRGRISELEQQCADLEEKRVEAEREALDRTEWALRVQAELDERTQWAGKLQAEMNGLRAHLDWVMASAWTKLGQFLRVLPWRADRSLKRP